MKRDRAPAHNSGQSNEKSARRKVDDASASSSSAASTGSDSYDVFLSFSGQDTRKTFADHLYNGLFDASIHVFRDNNELREGEKIGTNLLQAIKNSKISIPILSQNYASSKWCLEELVEMTECIKSGHVVLPIFYHVEPTHVRNQTGSFGEAFSRLSRKYPEDVEKWKVALQEVASLKGWESEKTADGREGELVKMVVRKVLSELKKAFRLDVTEHLVGIDNAVESILRLLDDNSSATQIVGIYGMGGIGKTTLAKAIHNRLSNQFQYHSFIADIRESSRGNGIFYLQNQLIRDLKEKDQVYNKDEGINIMGSRFKHKKVLILLDDVDDIKQIRALVGKYDCFEMGSRIVITTRSRSVLDEAEVKCKYKLEEMAEDKSLVLFSKHAFRRDSPPCEFESLSRAIVSTTKGLPLALEVLGSFLCGRNQAFWQDALKKFQEVPHEKVQEKLRISYDALNYEEKQIFLDIAWNFQMDRARWAFHMWDACKFFPNIGIETLSFMSLIKIGDDGMLQMHDQLRDLGREIIRQEDYHSPMNRSRVRLYNEGLKIFLRNKGIENLDVGDSSQSEFTTEQLEKLPNLRCLVVSGAKLIGDSKISLSELRILELDRCPGSMATKLHMEKLVVLLLSRSFISEHWEGWSYLKVAKQLKALVLTNCPLLRVTPDLSTFRHLEILIIKECRQLELIHPSIGEARGLSFFSLDGCVKLRELPQEMGKLKELKELYIGQTAIEEIPQCISSLKKLKILHANVGKSLVGIPRSIGHLVNLSILDLNNCLKLCRLPESIGKLEWLTILDLSLSGICKLPESIGDLKNLTTLNINFCQKLSSLPSTISKLGNLEKFYVGGCKSLVGEISLDGLSSLKILRLIGSSISGFVNGFDKVSRLEKLEELDATLCKNLGGEISIDGLSSLRILRLGYTSFSSFSNEFNRLSHLEKLEELDVSGCKNLEGEIPIDGLSSLRILRLCWTGISGFSNGFNKLFRLKKLEELDVRGCKNLGSRISGFVDGFDKLSQLKKLEELDAARCKNLGGEISIDGLSSLKILRLSWTSISGFADLFNKLSCLEKLEELDVTKCKNLGGKIFIDGLSSLRILRLGWTSVSGFSNKFNRLSCLEKLEELDVRECKNLGGEIPIDGLSSLKILRLSGSIISGFVDGFDKLSHLKKLEELDATRCKNLGGEIPINGLSSLKILRLGWTSVFGFSNEFNRLFRLEKLEELDATSCKNLGGEIFIDGLSSLKILRLGWTSVSSFSNEFNRLSRLEKLEELDVRGCKNLEGEIPIDGLSSLKILRLSVSSISGFVNGFDKVSRLEKLEELDATLCKNLGGEISIDGLSSLRILRLGWTSVSSFSNEFNRLSRLEKLEELDVRGCKNLEGEIPIDGLSSLKILRLSETSISGFPNLFNKLSRLEKLEELDAVRCKNLGGEILIDGLSSLRILRLGWTGISGFSNGFNKLFRLEKLEELDVRQCKNLGGEILMDGFSSLKILRLSGTNVSGFRGGFDKLSRLEELQLYDCKMLQLLPQSIAYLPSLQFLQLRRCRNLWSLPQLLAYLTILRVTCQHRTLPQLSHLVHLKVLIVDFCQRLKSMLDLPSRLLELCVYNCNELKELPSLSRLEFLSKLVLSCCTELTEIKGLKASKSLARFFVHRCRKLSNLDGLEHLSKNLEKLSLPGCRSIETLPNLSCFDNLTYLNIRGCSKLRDVQGLEKVANVYK